MPRIFIEPDEPRKLEKADKERTITHVVGNKLVDQYPGHWWVVRANIDAGLIQIQLQPFCGPQWGYTIKLHDWQSDPSQHCVVKAGGALLERFGLSRCGVKDAQLSDAIDLYGHVRPSTRKGYELGDLPRKAKPKEPSKWLTSTDRKHLIT